MRFCQIVTIFGFVAVSVAHELPPSPTASVGCEPHDDHWRCDGPRTTPLPGLSLTVSPSGMTTRPPAASTTATSSRDHDHDDDGDDDDDDDDHHSGTKTLPPSPTASVGCQPHGDHWHCDGPKTGSAAAGATTTTTTNGTTTPRPSGSAASSTPTPAGAARAGFGAAAIAAAGAVLIL
ncbi:hypothetical protein MCOR25_007678 [Pyricularia grisea]|uniref:GPI anchored protein n=1 Tax=Pyricularia grisea TaxID=148305 RepID=A0A6P8AMH2_PYRGI|nr:uncharacterized protein PgNI_12489 [Pyricularia grisea]KAI6357374.1 hypothetical protein MCOR25_007678 [Pyricularia grisea]TLD03231.1 hypothetical protein PgNI_12489 [Pyricularia grisea]